jgi:NCS1 family nucleobase:cation symporter-1
MPGFVAAVQPSVTVPMGLTHLYYICFLSGFAISASVFSLLHFIFPAVTSQRFVADGTSPRELMKEYQERWDAEIVESATDTEKNAVVESREVDASDF